MSLDSERSLEWKSLAKLANHVGFAKLRSSKFYYLVMESIHSPIIISSPVEVGGWDGEKYTNHQIAARDRHHSHIYDFTGLAKFPPEKTSS